MDEESGYCELQVFWNKLNLGIKLPKSYELASSWKRILGYLMDSILRYILICLILSIFGVFLNSCDDANYIFSH